MLSTSTHDTKRSEDVRARLAVLSEIPDRWAETVRRWFAHNDRHRTNGAPDRNTEYLLYQTLVGAHPLPVDRAQQYMLKAAREAKMATSWLAPDAAWEDALHTFVDRVLGDQMFRDDLDAFVRSIIESGRVNSLAQTLWRLTAPGVPDTYQGTDLWDLSLVDPDNRRPVDFTARRELLEHLRTLRVEDVIARADEGLPKLWLLHRALGVRARLPDAFGPEGSYRALHAEGSHADHVVAYERGGEVIAVAPLLNERRGGSWGDTHMSLPVGRWVDALSDAEHEGFVPLAGLLARFPVALLVRAAPSDGHSSRRDV